jgi:hypothetical protein
MKRAVVENKFTPILDLRIEQGVMMGIREIKW